MSYASVVRIVALSLALATTRPATVAAEGKGNGSALKVQAAEFDPGRVCDAKPAWVRGIGFFAVDDRFASAFLMHKLCSPTRRRSGSSLA
jgi:hypothetical protein